ncbi:hypothetical protein, partial [Methylobacterium planeticum]|uniref:hypothetical protein n=1 Tax=Methylobacterium planeticum TaxID=2615211 RepID=UPI001786F450
YLLINFFVPNADMIIAVRCIACASHGVVLYVYGHDAWLAFRKREPARSDYLILGIWLSFLSQILQSAFAILSRLSGMQSWFVNAEIWAPAILLSVTAAVLHTATPGALDGVVPRRNRIAMGVGLGFAILSVLGLVASKPDIRPYLDRARPYISDWFNTNALFHSSEPPDPPKNAYAGAGG